MRRIASPIKGAIETWRTFLQPLTGCGASMESVITSSFSTDLVTRSHAAPERTPWVT